VNIPDHISPIVGYRTWQWDALGLKSLNNERWFPGPALEAACKPSRNLPRSKEFMGKHEPTGSFTLW
jgi:hypothetical protein